MTDHIDRSLKNGVNAYVVPFDIAGAFRKVLGDLQTDVHIKRVARNRLKERTLRVKMGTAAGEMLFSTRSVSRCLPH